MKTTLLLNMARNFWLITIASALLLMTNISDAQTCAATCAIINIEFSNSCSDITVTPSQVSTDLTDGCTYTLTFVRMGDPTAPPILTPADIGTSVMYTLTATDNNAACMSVINVSAGSGIIVFCPEEPIELDCGVSVFDLPAPEAVACNGANVSSAIMGSPIQNGMIDCDGDFYRVVTVNYVYSDGNGASATCQVTYNFRATDPLAILAPEDVTLECGPNLDLTPENLGVPTINGEPFSDFTSCNLMLSDPVDNDHQGCGGSRLISRTWTIMDWCDPMGTPRIIVQNIAIEDNTPPSILLPVTEVYGSALPNSCSSGILILPPATISDACTPTGSILVSMFIPTVGFVNSNGTTVNNIPVGEHIVTYTATDLCGRTASATLQITVVDDSGPNVVCNTASTVTLNNLGLATVPAHVFNNGSSDNCGPVYFKVKRMDASDCDPNPVFDDSVDFCCTDLNGPIMVILRVYDVNPGAGPVSDDAFEENSNECMIVVTVQDKQLPSVTCPGDVTVDCLFDLDFYLTNDVPVAVDNCSHNLTSSVTINTSGLNECGLGVAVRTIQYTDGVNNLTCVNNIVVENVDVQNPITIVWPVNTMLVGCGGSIEPEDLPADASMPVITVANCAQIAMTYTDAVFDIVEDACFKVIRTWQVLDWCSYDPSNGTGIYTHHQLIKVLDDEAPEIIGLEDVALLIEVEDDCTIDEAFVALPTITATDCTPLDQMRFRYRIDYGNDGNYETGFINGNNASGVFPYGESRVQFRVDDLCGNFTTGSLIVTVNIEDNKKPTPVLKNLQTALMPGTGMVGLQAHMFNSDSYDNCTEKAALRYSFSDDINNTTRVFTCDDLDTAMVTIYVWDEAGNFDFATVALSIDDNGADCDPDDIGDGGAGRVVSGRIVNENNEVIESVVVNLMNSDLSAVSTGQDGAFKFENVPGNRSYEICPTKNINPRNGVSVIDILHIQRHILGIERLNSPYKLLAADVNKSGTITGADLVAIQRVLLGRSDQFEGNPAWRFVDADYHFSDPEFPFYDAIPEVFKIQNLNSEVVKSFVGVKMGDVDHSARLTGAFTGDLSSRSNQFISIDVENKWLEKGEFAFIPMKASQFRAIEGFQGTLQVNPNLANFMGWMSASLPNFGKESFHTGFLESGIIPFVWFTQEAVTLEDGDVLFNLRIQAKENAYLSDILNISDDFINAEYAGISEHGQLRLEFTNIDPTISENKLLQNKPNPFSAETTISFYLANSTNATLSIMDMAGRVVFVQQAGFDRGNNDITIDVNKLGGAGVYLYRLDAPGFSDTKRMVLVSN